MRLKANAPRRPGLISKYANNTLLYTLSWLHHKKYLVPFLLPPTFQLYFLVLKWSGSPIQIIILTTKKCSTLFYNHKVIPYCLSM